tara:strand:- start:232 stop:609 length:378 start_codon:yes stop_codon:yes gene_type:complete
MLNKEFLISGVIMLLMDMIYLSSFGKKLFSPLIKSIQGSDLKVNIYYALACYLIMIFGLNYFIISKNKSISDAFILGILVYGVFDTTSGAIFKKWTFKAAITDTIWGGLLFASVTYLTKKISNKL